MGLLPSYGPVAHSAQVVFQINPPDGEARTVLGECQIPNYELYLGGLT